MSFKLYLSFLAASVVLIYAPGPVNLLTMNQALRAGWRRALPCVWGGTLAVLLQLALTALCLNSLVHLNEHALTVLRWAGAAYLVWLGAKQWLSRAPAGAPAAAAEAGTATGTTIARQDTDTDRALFWRGVATSGLNPKTLLFFPSFFPQFISPTADWSLNLQFLLLATTFAVLFAGGVASMALFSHRLSRALQRPARMRAMNRVTGGLLVGMGAIMVGWN
ncbi:MAG: LysE family translocator [Burkholderia sp.]|jgi:threonine/homoserine/homoserine lactone efflux protein|uniref:LysE family translocator n=2 Tax=Burkholderiaceae TaxID=119060 RepID=UPI00158DBB36|nr:MULTISPECIES: LysE family translocator [Burkholderia]MBY8607985.1 LysE family translocator [Burkholderia arboris]MCA3776384.1 LysE family translocator [Burkholderia sp.]MCA3790801.1 LysE family translocator [Burkholderia sp.]MCA3804014.1 LysE family translocator [Burkholderia sp.]MCA3810779.1 LysE family translocator [Burkholderia sp.]